MGNLSFQTTRDELAQLMSEAGQVVDVHIATDRDTGRPRGFAFVEFASEAEAEKAARLFDGRELGQRQLRVNAAEERRDGGRSRPPAGGGRGGGPRSGGDSFDPRKQYKSKGSRRGLRAKKRSL